MVMRSVILMRVVVLYWRQSTLSSFLQSSGKFGKYGRSLGTRPVELSTWNHSVSRQTWQATRRSGRRRTRLRTLVNVHTSKQLSFYACNAPGFDHLQIYDHITPFFSSTWKLSKRFPYGTATIIFRSKKFVCSICPTIIFVLTPVTPRLEPTWLPSSCFFATEMEWNICLTFEV